MIRNLLATTAIATLLATGAYAQSSTAPETADPAQSGEQTQPADGAASTQQDGADTGETAQDTEMQPGEETSQDVEVETVPAEDTAQSGATDAEMADTGNPEVEGQLASNLIGARVFNGTSDDAENIGEVNDVVIGKDGKAEFVVIGVGGFLGIGEKDVALEYATLQWAERDGDMWLVVETTSEQLEQQPAFDRTAYDPEAMAANEQTAAAGGEAEIREDTAATAPATTGEAMESEDNVVVTTVPTDEASDDMAASDTAEAPAEDDAAMDAAEAPADDAEAMDTAEAPADEAAATDQTQTGAIDRSTLQETDMSAIRAEDFVGTTVYGANEETIGEIGDVILTDDGQVDAVLIDVGGFLGMGEKEIAVGMDNLQFMEDGDGNRYLYTQWTQEQLEAQPAYDEANYAENRDEMRMTIEN